MNPNLSSRGFRAALIMVGLSTMAPAITAPDLSKKLKAGEVVHLIDLRSQVRYESGTIPGAMSIPAAIIEGKKLPPLSPVVLFDDGMAGIDVEGIAARLNERPGWKADILEGGFAAWRAQADAPQTSPAGLKSEDIQHITYDDLVQLKEKVVLLDLRPGSSTPVPPAGDAKPSARGQGKPPAPKIESSPAKDAVADFCGKAGNRTYKHGLESFRKQFKGDAGKIARAGRSEGRPSAPVAQPDAIPPLVVLVDTVESDNRETVRRLHSEGYPRVLILAGGDESIQLQGRRGKGRISGTLGQGSLKDPAPQPKPDKS